MMPPKNRRRHSAGPKQSSPGWWVLGAGMPLPMALDHVNVYALDDGDGWTVFDTGFDTISATRAGLG